MNDAPSHADPSRPSLGPRPDDGDVGAIVWPIWRRFLNSDLTLKELAKRAALKPKAIERAFLDPGAQRVGIWGAIAFGLDCRLTPELYPQEEHEARLAAALGFTRELLRHDARDGASSHNLQPPNQEGGEHG